MKGLLRYGGVLEASFAGLEGETAAAAVYLHKDPEFQAALRIVHMKKWRVMLIM
tara:strand:+ start:3529 stop:3690 length:162 start_codon:yes stop_codon:yes gene_type:complete